MEYAILSNKNDYIIFKFRNRVLNLNNPDSAIVFSQKGQVLEATIERYIQEADANDQAN